MNNSKNSSTATLLPTYRKATTREQILQAALTCFSGKGYHRTTMDDIVKESGLSKGALYWHFKSKQELFIALIDWFMAEFSEEISQAWTDEMSATDKIRAIVQVFLDETEQLIPFFKITLDFWAQTPENERLQRIFWTWLKRYQRQIAQVIEAGIASGEFRPVNAEQAALALVALLDGVGLYKTMLDAEIDLHNTVQTTIEVFLTGLKKETDQYVA